MSVPVAGEKPLAVSELSLKDKWSSRARVQRRGAELPAKEQREGKRGRADVQVNFYGIFLLLSELSEEIKDLPAKHSGVCPLGFS